MREKERKVSKKRSHLKEFKRREDGSYSYEGKMLYCSLSGSAYRNRVLGMLLISMAALGVTVTAGCFTGTGMEGHFYLVIPYAGTLVILIRLVWNLAQLLHAGPVLREYAYKRTAERLPPQVLGGMLLPLLALAGVLYGRVKGSYIGNGAGAVVFVLSQVVSFAGCLTVWLLKKELRWS